MSTEKVVRFNVWAVSGNDEYPSYVEFDQDDEGRYIEYADVAGLIEAAPDMHEALEDAEQMLFDAAHAFRKIGMEWHGYAETCDSRRAQIEAALAKARGEG